MRRLAASAAVVVALAGGFTAGRVTAHNPQIASDTGTAAVYDGCTYQAFLDHASPKPCWRFLP